ncbi:hypothetical protein ACIP5Y_38170 [Nocardia sp. NPDC088792]|uniref:hypothetical protein n=1 Tax=Nocardia sp. NPDC088792 TaxID=3364332 RepID=UPI0037F815F3
MIVALAGAVAFVVFEVVWVVRLIHMGNLDAHELAVKMGVPTPVSALDWPDMRLKAVVAQPDDRLVLVSVDWSAHPGQSATLLLALEEGDARSLSLLSEWCAGQASVSPLRYPPPPGLVLRRRQSLERVHARLLAEDLP